MKMMSREPSNYYSHTEVWHVRSDCVGDVFRICVSAPPSLRADEKAAAVFVLDGDVTAGVLVGETRIMTMGAQLPPLFAVAIAYPFDHKPGASFVRSRDLTPTCMEYYDALQPKLYGIDDQALHVKSGGGDAFLAFLVDELQPALAEVYPIDLKATTLAGMSLGGLFTLHALMTRPRSFRYYLAMCPAIWWDSYVILKRARAIGGFDPAVSGGLHICLGEYEKPEFAKLEMDKLPRDVVNATKPFWGDEYNLANDVEAMRAAMASKVGPEFHVSSSEIARESHQSMIGAAISQGLRILHRTVPQLLR